MTYEKQTRHATKAKAIEAGENWYEQNANPVNAASYRTFPFNRELPEGETILEVKHYGND